MAGLAILVAATVPVYTARDLTLWTTYGLLALSLTLVWGRAGIFSFGQAAFFGIGGYAYGIASINLIGSTGETMSAFAIATIVAAAAAGVLGYFMFYGNLGDVYVAIVTLATTLVLLTFMSSTASPSYHIGSALFGGYNGMVAIPPLSYWAELPLSDSQFLVVMAILGALAVAGLRVLLRSPFGRVATAVRENELRTQLLGYDVRRTKLAVFVVGGAIAGLAGAGYAAWGQFMNPAVFGLQQAALVVIWVLVGGRRSLPGAFVGAFLVEWITTRFASSSATATPVILGGILIGIVLLLPRGLVPSGLWLAQRAWPRLAAEPEPPPAPAERLSAPPLRAEEAGVLEAVEVGKTFGGLRALQDVTLVFPLRGVHCLIGPNGAGKSTLFNLLVGRYRPSSGRIVFGGEEITRRRADERARRGLGIKLQVASLYDELSALENVWLAAYARTRSPRAADERAVAILDWLGLLERAHEPAGILAHGQQQWLEIGVVLAAEPSVVLLDEPTAGMTREETLRTAELVTELGEHSSVLVVEHDMEFVRRLDVPVTVFHQGRVFAQGSLEELRRDERVLDVYLGRRAAPAESEPRATADPARGSL